MELRTCIFHVNDIPWYKAPLPRRFHRCKAQSWGMLNWEHWDRCACGAFRRNYRRWVNKNERRHK